MRTAERILRFAAMAILPWPMAAAIHGGSHAPRTCTNQRKENTMDIISQGMVDFAALIRHRLSGIAPKPKPKPTHQMEQIGNYPMEDTRTYGDIQIGWVSPGDHMLCVEYAIAWVGDQWIFRIVQQFPHELEKSGIPWVYQLQIFDGHGYGGGYLTLATPDRRMAELSAIAEWKATRHGKGVAW